MLEICHISGGELARQVFPGHTADRCAIATEQRIRVLEEMHVRDSYQLESQQAAINDLGTGLAACGQIITAGRKWLIERTRRREDIARLRKAFSTGDQDRQHPLWQAENDVADAIEKAIDLLENRSAS